MKNRIEVLLTRMFVVLYAAACSLAICMEEKCHLSGEKTETGFVEHITATQKTAQHAELVWLKLVQGAAEFSFIEGFVAEERKEIDAATLEKILSPDFYISGNGNNAHGMFFPLAMISYSSNGSDIAIVYSFMNAEVRMFQDGVLTESSLLYNVDALSDIFENL